MPSSHLSGPGILGKLKNNPPTAPQPTKKGSGSGFRFFLVGRKNKKSLQKLLPAPHHTHSPEQGLLILPTRLGPEPIVIHGII